MRLVSVRSAVAVVVGLAGLSLAVAARWSPRSLPAPFAGARPPAPRALEHEWRLVNGKHWQIASETQESRTQVDAREGTRGGCLPGMVEVKGRMRVDPPGTELDDQQRLEELQKNTCSNWISKKFPERCQTFDRAKWLEVAARFGTQPMHFCIDRFEYPNQKGEYPVILVSWPEAAALCDRQGKRLCTEDEWTFACEGEEATPYPYGYERDANACVCDHEWRAYNLFAFSPRDGALARDELDRLWQGAASGSRPRCRSSFGVYDLTGNVDEWTVSVRAGERPTILKGGYWGPVRTRCRPSTRKHDDHHVFYQQGFRCCAGPPVTRPTGAAAGVVEGPVPGALR
jgi:sulfatase modifying factor 1